MKFNITVNNKNYEVDILNADPPIFEVSVNGKKALINVEERKEQHLTGNEVVAEMSGTVVRIVVEEGSKVKKGEPLLILEAMKMENEVVSPSDGKIEKILVEEGEKVSTGTPLVVLSCGEGIEIKVAMSGVITKILKNVNEEIDENEPLLILEAMKMENEVVSPVKGKIVKIFVKEGDKVSQGDVVAIVSSD